MLVPCCFQTRYSLTTYLRTVTHGPRQNHTVAGSKINISLRLRHIMKNKQPLCFGGVRLGKSYVSFYLMSVYASPELLKNISPELRKRMQGMSCFNFKKVDKKLFSELKTLTKDGASNFSDGKFVAQLRMMQG